MLTSETGSVSDGSGDYSSYANCQWIIAPSGASQITLTFTSFKTESGYDYVRVSSCSDSTCGTKVLLRELSGTYSTLPVVTSSTGYMLIELTSDSSTVYSGFIALWTPSSSLSSSSNVRLHLSSPKSICLYYLLLIISKRARRQSAHLLVFVTTSRVYYVVYLIYVTRVHVYTPGSISDEYFVAVNPSLLWMRINMSSIHQCNWHIVRRIRKLCEQC